MKVSATASRLSYTFPVERLKRRTLASDTP